jgi:hypothetical protein
LNGGRFPQSRWAMLAIGFAVCLVGAIAFFKIRMLYWDNEVDKLCAGDGGVKIYATATVTPDELSVFGDMRPPYKNDMTPKDKYFVEWSRTYVHIGYPEVWRSHFALFRRSDKNLLGESITYTRFRGDFPGPWHPSSHICSFESGVEAISKKVFSVIPK